MPASFITRTDAPLKVLDDVSPDDAKGTAVLVLAGADGTSNDRTFEALAQRNPHLAEQHQVRASLASGHDSAMKAGGVYDIYDFSDGRAEFIVLVAVVEGRLDDAAAALIVANVESLVLNMGIDTLIVSPDLITDETTELFTGVLFDYDGLKVVWCSGVDDADEFGIEANPQPTIRAKWTMDGAKTLAEAAEQIRAYATWLDQQAADGWELTDPVEDDYGFLHRPS